MQLGKLSLALEQELKVLDYAFSEDVVIVWFPLTVLCFCMFSLL